MEVRFCTDVHVCTEQNKRNKVDMFDNQFLCFIHTPTNIHHLQSKIKEKIINNKIKHFNKGFTVECDFILNKLLHWKSKQDVLMSTFRHCRGWEQLTVILYPLRKLWTVFQKSQKKKEKQQISKSKTKKENKNILFTILNSSWVQIITGRRKTRSCQSQK